MAAVNIWFLATILLLLGFIPCGICMRRGSPGDRLVALEMCGILAILILLLLAQGTQRPSFDDLAVTLALLSFPGGLVFARLMERGL